MRRETVFIGDHYETVRNAVSDNYQAILVRKPAQQQVLPPVRETGAVQLQRREESPKTGGVAVRGGKLPL